MPEYVLNWHDEVLEFNVVGASDNYFEGICRLEPKITIKDIQN
jgi:hypothetical protein